MIRDVNIIGHCVQIHDNVDMETIYVINERNRQNSRIHG